MKRKPVPPPNEKKSAPAHIQGEGDYEAARRYRRAVEGFVHTQDIEAAARAAAPRDEHEAKELAAAEAAGRSHARQPRKPTSRKA
jgi:hypothetical protein